MVPTGNDDPDALEGVKLAIAQLSEAVGAVQLTAAAQKPASLLVVMFDGMPEITGNSVSLTVMVKFDVVTFPFTSVAM